MSPVLAVRHQWPLEPSKMVDIQTRLWQWADSQGNIVPPIPHPKAESRSLLAPYDYS
jgi:hypothetical protein